MSSRSTTAGRARAALALALVLALAVAAAAHAAGARELDLTEEDQVQAGGRRALLFGRGIGLGIREGIRALEDVFSSLG